SSFPCARLPMRRVTNRLRFASLIRSGKQMRAVLWLAAVCGLAVASWSQAQNYLWATNPAASDTFGNNGNAVAVGTVAGVHVTGSSGARRRAVGTKAWNKPAPSGGIFLAKCNTAGKRQWAQSAPGNDNDAGNALAVDSLNNVYLAGTFTSSTL